jgi:hypothetical protein
VAVDARDDAKSILADVSAADFTAVAGQDRATPYVTIGYNYDWAANGFTAAPTVTVYRAEIIGKTGGVGGVDDYTSKNTGITNDGWTAVTLSWKSTTTVVDGTITPNYKFSAEDTTGLAVGKSYVYALSLTAGTQTAGSTPVKVNIDAVGLKSAKLSGVIVATENKKKAADGTPDGTQVVVNWIGDTTSTYAVTRAVVNGAEIGDYVAITGAPVKDDKSLASDDNSVVYRLTDTTAAYRTTYAYKVTGTSSDSLINVSAAATVADNAFLTKAPYNSGAASIEGNVTATVGSKKITFALTSQQTVDQKVYTGETVRF